MRILTSGEICSSPVGVLVMAIRRGNLPSAIDETLLEEKEGAYEIESLDL